MSLLTHPFTADCAETARRLPAHADGALGRIHRRRVERHLAVCPGCRRMFDLLMRGLDALRDVRRDPPPTTRSIADAVLERIRDEDTRQEGHP